MDFLGRKGCRGCSVLRVACSAAGFEGGSVAWLGCRLGGADLLSHGFEGAVEVGLDGVDGDAGGGGDLGELQLFGETHEEDGALVGREVLERGVDLGRFFFHEEAGFRGGLVGAEEVGGFGDVDGGGAGLAPEAEFLKALVVADEVDGDGGEPGADGAVSTETVAGVVGLEEAILGDGLG